MVTSPDAITVHLIKADEDAQPVTITIASVQSCELFIEYLTKKLGKKPILINDLPLVPTVLCKALQDGGMYVVEMAGGSEAKSLAQAPTKPAPASQSTKPAWKGAEVSDGIAAPAQKVAQEPAALSSFDNPFRPPVSTEVDLGSKKMAAPAKPTSALRLEPKAASPTADISIVEPPPPAAATALAALLESPFGPRIVKEAPAPPQPLTAAERRRRRRQQAPARDVDSPVLSIHSSPPISPLRFDPSEVMQGWDTLKEEEPVLPFLSLLEKSHAPLPPLPPQLSSFPPPPTSAPPPLNDEAQERRRSRFASNESSGPFRPLGDRNPFQKSSDPFDLPRRRSPTPPPRNSNPFEQFPPVRPSRLTRGRSPSPARPAPPKMVVEEAPEKVLARQRRFGTANSDATASKPRSISPPRASPIFTPRPISWEDEDDDLNFKRRRLL